MRHHGDGKRMARGAAHGKDIVEGVVRGDLTEYIGIIDEAAEQIDGCNDVVSTGWRRQHGRVVRCSKPDGYIIVDQRRTEARERPRQRAGPDLGGATAAA